jgi:transposase
MILRMSQLLTPTQRAELLSHHKAERMRRFADRIKAVLLIDSGWTYEEVAEALFLDDATVRRYLQAYQAEGVTGLVKDAYKGGVSKLTAFEENELVQHLLQVTYASTKEIVEYVDKTYDTDFTLSGMRYLLKRLGFAHIKPKVVPGKADAQKQTDFVASYEALKDDLGPNDRIYFADAAHPIHNAIAGYGWMLKGSPRELKTNCARARINLNGAVDPITLDVIVRQEDAINSTAVIGLLKQIESKNPNAEVIYFICDNARYYKSKDVAEWLEKSCIEMVNLPSYSPNLNIVERLWKYFRAEVMANTYYATFAEFQTRTSEFFRLIRHRAADLRTLLVDNFETFEFT